MKKTYLQKLTLFLATIPFSIGVAAGDETKGKENEPIGAAAIYKKISSLMESGEVVAAHALMTADYRADEIGSVLVDVAADLASKRPLPKKLADGTEIEVSPADLGFGDSWTPPAWMNTNKMAGSADEWDALEADLLKQFNGLDDRDVALKKLHLLNRAMGDESYIGETVVEPRQGFEPRPNRLWIVSKDDPDSPVPLLFEKVDGEWKLAGMDWDTDDEIAKMWKFVEKKDHPIAGKGPHGEDVSLKGLKGKVVLLDFWGTW